MGEGVDAGNAFVAGFQTMGRGVHIDTTAGFRGTLPRVYSVSLSNLQMLSYLI